MKYDASSIWQLLVNGLVTGSVYAIAAAGVSLLYGILRLVNFAFGDMMALGAFLAYPVNVSLRPADDRSDSSRACGVSHDHRLTSAGILRLSDGVGVRRYALTPP